MDASELVSGREQDQMAAAGYADAKDHFVWSPAPNLLHLAPGANIVHLAAKHSDVANSQTHEKTTFV